MRALPYFYSGAISDKAVDYTYTVNTDCKTVTFTGSSIIPGPVNWEWNFGDGTKATGQTVTHAFSDIGDNFNVLLTAVNPGICGGKGRKMKNIRFNREKIDLLRELELLIIDEVSMLRADALDAIDTILRHFRRRHREPFGGVQVLYIGDLFQLPPVIRNEESGLFFEHYTSPFFFSAKVIGEEHPLVIELKTIYRQTDAEFIHVLNAIRTNKMTEDELDTLHQRYMPYVQPEDGVIVLTTHNHKADTINAQRLEALPGKAEAFEGLITGEFNEKALPAERMLQLKIGAQVMFIKNDKGETRRYYNGKLATVCRIGDDGGIWVRLAGSNEELQLEQHTWKSVRYRYDQEKDEIDEEELGAYKQYPVRLAWAITIHKSQGLTFERAIVDAGQSFAAGQVYVALSRLTSLGGMVLHSRIPAQGIEMPEAVISFCRKEMEEGKLQELVFSEEASFAQRKMVQWFSLAKLIHNWSTHQEGYQFKAIPSQEAAIAWSNKILDALLRLEDTAERFRMQLEGLLGRNTDYEAVRARVVAARAWFDAALEAEVIQPLMDHHKGWSGKPRTKKYLSELHALETAALLVKKGLQQAEYLATGLAGGTAFTDIALDVPMERSRLAATSIPDAPKPKKGDTYSVTLAMHKEGKSLVEIAAARGVTEGTIEGHLTRFIATGEVAVTDIVPADKVEIIIAELERHEDPGRTSAAKAALGELYTYGMIRAVSVHLAQLKVKGEVAE